MTSKAPGKLSLAGLLGFIAVIVFAAILGRAIGLFVAAHWAAFALIAALGLAGGVAFIVLASRRTVRYIRADMLPRYVQPAPLSAAIRMGEAFRRIPAIIRRRRAARPLKARVTRPPS